MLAILLKLKEVAMPSKHLITEAFLKYIILALKILTLRYIKIVNMYVVVISLQLHIKNYKKKNHI